ncbi:elongation factor 1-alpha [Fusarium beomiforme]|uniref:Elongation factor 1 alpha-like protein n=1 Tax=Fusarium beomiforme TaxID=44412 RepID=A0A9P5DTT9_9HYPO|nr:elongation factor 1-alpha [Fusarium beomiforme]
MSRHRIVHTFDTNEIVSEFDGDDYEEDEEDELSPEDRQAMDDGTAEVRRVLGTEANKVTKAQIEEALWHYYYDIDKSVTYLMKTFIAPAPKPAKKAPEDRHLSIMDLPPALGLPTWHFDDMPWLGVPEERQAVFIEPERPRGGLLGGGEGAPKMSKLQALAAARKKKTEEKKGLERAERGMERLSINESQKENQPILGRARQNLEPTLQVKLPLKEEPTEIEAVTNNHQQGDIKATPKGWSVDEDFPVIMPRATPSAFARTLFGSAPANPPSPDEVFAMPYTSSPIFVAEAFAEPSPDDVVLAAQAKAGKKPVAKPSKKAQKDVSEVEKDVAGLKIAEAPPPKSKGLDVLKEYENSSNKRSISFVVVGHVDAGKSTLMGRLLLELKFVEKHTIDRYRKQAEKSGKQSFALAWVMDQRSEERERGVTIDIATNYFETEKTSFTILDAPGHRDFVPNMIAGASQADFAILVIDANTGAYEKGLKGQTREHVLLLRSLGVQRLVIAVNKLDMVGWSQERFDEIAQQVNGFLAGLGFQPKNIDFIPISGLNGDNLVRRTQDKAASWYTGPTLIEALENSEPSTSRALKSPFRMSISEVFRSQLGTTTIAGRVDSGSVQIGDALLVQPSGEEAYVKSIMVDSDMQDWAVAGQSVSVALANIDPIHIRVGDMLCHTKDPINCGDTFTMKAMAFEHLMPMPVDLHRGRLHSAGQIVSITATLDKASGAIIRKKPRVVQPGGVARVVIKLAAKVPLEPGQRVVIRSGGETVAAGLLE